MYKCYRCILIKEWVETKYLFFKKTTVGFVNCSSYSDLGF